MIVISKHVYYKIGYVAAILGFLTLAIAWICIAMIQGREALERENMALEREICVTDVCKNAAQEINLNRNINADPCENFYEFVCGGWKKRHPIPTGELYWGQLQEADNSTIFKIKEILESVNKVDDLESTKSARKFYQRCLATRGSTDQNLQILVNKLSAWGGWPLLRSDWEERKFNWQKLEVELARTTADPKQSLSPLFHFKISLKPKDTSRFAIHLGPTTSTLCTAASTFENFDRISQILISRPAEQISNFTKQELPDHYNKDLTDVLSFVKDICEITKTKLRSTPDDLYPSTSLAELQELTSNMTLTQKSSVVNWKTIMKDFAYGSGIKLTLDDYLVTQPDVIINIIKLIDTTPPRTLANYMLTHKVLWMRSFIAKDQNSTIVQSRRCVHETRAAFPHAVGYEYVKLFFTEDDRAEAFQIVNHTINSFITDLSQNKWMDEETKSAAIEKAKNILPVVGYPDWYMRPYKMQAFVPRINVGENHVENMEKATLGNILFRIKLIPNAADRQILLKSAAEVNSAYYPQENIINIPAGILQPPFYVKGRPDSLNFGALVSIISHEITHAFDLTGRKGDKFGNAVSWWSEDSQRNYFTKAGCYLSQYKKYYIPELHDTKVIKLLKTTHLNPTMTLSEDLADNGGLQAAFNAFARHSRIQNNTRNRLPEMPGYSPEQLFFIGFASNWCETSTWISIFKNVLTDPHSPSKYRVLLPLTNSKEFADAWNCPEFSNMNPLQKCQLW